MSAGGPPQRDEKAGTEGPRGSRRYRPARQVCDADDVWSARRRPAALADPYPREQGLLCCWHWLEGSAPAPLYGVDVTHRPQVEYCPPKIHVHRDLRQIGALPVGTVKD